MDAVEIIMKLEEKYSINIPDDEAEKMTTAGAIVRYVAGKLKGQYPK